MLSKSQIIKKHNKFDNNRNKSYENSESHIQKLSAIKIMNLSKMMKKLTFRILMKIVNN